MNCICVPGLAQYETTKAYMPKEPDELGLRPAEVVILLGKELGKNQHPQAGAYVMEHMQPFNTNEWKLTI